STETGETARARIGVFAALDVQVPEHRRIPAEEAKRTAARERRHREAAIERLPRPATGRRSKAAFPAPARTAARHVAHHTGQRRAVLRAEAARDDLDFLERRRRELETEALRRALELVLRLEPVDDVHLLADAPAAEVSARHAGCELDRFRDAVHGQFA